MAGPLKTESYWSPDSHCLHLSASCLCFRMTWKCEEGPRLFHVNPGTSRNFEVNFDTMVAESCHLNYELTDLETHNSINILLKDLKVFEAGAPPNLSIMEFSHNS